MPRSPLDFLALAGIAAALVFPPPARAAGPEETPPGAAKDGAAAAPAGNVRDRAHLGIFLAPRVPGDEKSGVVVTYVHPASAAKEMGFQAGDEVRVVNDVIVTGVRPLIAEIQRQTIGSKQRFTVIRGGKEIKLEGRIASHEKTMRAYQEVVRKDLVGKPLPPLPALSWWDAAPGGWKEAGGDISTLRGKHSVVFSFDDCQECTQKRYLVFSGTKAVLDRTAPGAPLAFLGIFYNEPKGKEQSLKAAEALFRRSPPPFPVAVASYPGDKPPPEDRHGHSWLHSHGTVILDPAGAVEYIQTHGTPEAEFLEAYKKTLEKAGAAGGGEPGKPPAARPGGSGP